MTITFWTFCVVHKEASCWATFLFNRKHVFYAHQCCYWKDIFHKFFFFSFSFFFSLMMRRQKSLEKLLFSRCVTNGKKRPIIMMLIMFGKMHDGEKCHGCFFLLPTQLEAFIFCAATILIEVAVSFIPLKVLNGFDCKKKEKIERLKHQSWNLIHGPDRLQWSQNVLLLHEF